MAFDHRDIPPELVFKLEEAKRDEIRQLEPTDAAHPFPSAPVPEYSPVQSVVEEMMAHWAIDSDPFMLAEPDSTTKRNAEDKNKGSKDLDDKMSIKSGIGADFVPDSAGPATDVGMPEAKPVGGNEFGGGGGGGGSGGGGDGGGAEAGGGDDMYFEVDMWRRKRRSGDVAPDEEAPVEEEEAPVEESNETETSKS